MKNSLGRLVPEGFVPFNGSSQYKNRKVNKIPSKNCSEKVEFLQSYSELFDKLEITDGMTLSFHHHLRNGDYVLNSVCEEIKKRNLKNMVI
jgi:citrate lyase subunit alpha/citrate CoA-transferase